MNPRKYIKWVRRLAFVSRWSCIPVIRSQNVSDHTTQVMAILRVLLPHHAQNSSEFALDCFVRALDHDLEEAGRGDPPSTIKPKKDYKTLAKTRGQVYMLVKLADLVEAACFLREERMMGNKYHLGPIIRAYDEEIKECCKYTKFKQDANPITLLIKMIGFWKDSIHPTQEEFDD